MSEDEDFFRNASSLNRQIEEAEKTRRYRDIAAVFDSPEIERLRSFIKVRAEAEMAMELEARCRED